MLENIRHFLFLGIILYLISSIPIAYVWVKIKNSELDLTQIGTGNLGASNTKNVLGILSAVLIALIDAIGKGFIPIYILSNISEYSWELFLYGLIIVLGHNWSIFINFKGGRGIAVSIGILLAIDPLRLTFLIIAIPVVLGRWIVYKDSAFWTFVTIILLNVITFSISAEIMEKIFTVGLAILLIGKRILSNEYSFSKHLNKFEVFMCRIVFDRDIRSKYLWINK